MQTDDLRDVTNMNGPNDANDITYTMQLEGMTCAHCEQTVRQALEVAGAHGVQASFRRGEATFQAPESADGSQLEELNAAVREAGYRPGSVIPTAGMQKSESLMGLTVQSSTTSQQAVGDGVSESEYDLAVLGSGGAAMAAAITAVGDGARVVMIERGTIGGTCVNIGCIPSKTLLRASETYHQAKHHPFEGIETSSGNVDLAAMVGQKDKLVAELRKDKYADLIEEYGWDLVKGEARFIDERTLSVAGAQGKERRITARAFVVATGADPAIPPIPGLAEAGCLTSTSALALKELPESLFVIGAGYIGLELGQLFSRLGTRVILAQRGTRLLDEYEPEIGELMHKVLEDGGVEVITGARIEKVERVERPEKPGKQGNKAGCKVYLTIDGEPQVREVSHVLVATGRHPNTEALNLGAAGIKVDERGAIVVDTQLRTTNPQVWAAGDVTLGPQFVYVAAYESKLAAENALRDAGRTVDFTALPGITFTSPQIAVVGLTEDEARSKGLKVKTTVLPLDVVPRAQVNHDTTGLVKLVAEEGSNRILGVHMVAENAGDVIYAGTLAVKHGLTIEDLVESFAPYLTMSESLKLVAQSFGRDVHKLSCCAA